MSSCTITHTREEFEFQDWMIDFEAEATSIHEPMVKYYPDGSGFPGYDSIEDIQYTITKVTDGDCQELELNDEGYPVSWTEEQVKAADKAIMDYLDDVEWDYPEPDYPDERD